MVTNFRGFADTFTRHADASASGLRKLPPWKWQRQPGDLAGRTRMVRIIAIPFAILGPIMTGAGIVAMARGHITIPNEPSLPAPLGFAIIALTVLSIGLHWRRNGFFRAAAQRGGWRRAVAIIASVGSIAFGVCLALGQLTIGIVVWPAAGLPVMLLFMERKSIVPKEDGTSSGSAK